MLDKFRLYAISFRICLIHLIAGNSVFLEFLYLILRDIRIRPACILPVIHCNLFRREILCPHAKHLRLDPEHQILRNQNHL